MSVKTLQYIEVDTDPVNSYTLEPHPKYWDVPLPFANAVKVLIDSPEEADCDQCGGGVGYYLEETDDGRLEHAYWHYTALLLHGPEYPVVVLCEVCAEPVLCLPAPLKET